MGTSEQGGGAIHGPPEIAAGQGQSKLEDRLDLLLEASRSLLAQPRLEEVVSRLLDLSRRLISAEAYAIWRLDAAAGYWRMVSSAGLSDAYCRHEVPARESEELASGVMQFEDVSTAPLIAQRRGMYAAEGIGSLLVVPIEVQGRYSGTISFYDSKPRRFTNTEVRLGTALANLAGSALSTAELTPSRSGTAGARKRPGSALLIWLRRVHFWLRLWTMPLRWPA